MTGRAVVPDDALERLTCRRDHRRVERARDRQETAGDSTARGQIDRLAHGIGGPGDHGLLGAVPVGGEYIGNLTDQAIDIGTPGAQGRHRTGAAGAGFAHQAAALAGKLGQGGRVADSGGVERDQLAEAMPAE